MSFGRAACDWFPVVWLSSSPLPYGSCGGLLWPPSGSPIKP